MTLLDIKNLHIGFRIPGGVVPAVRGVSLSLERGGTTALVGESGSGKTVISYAIMGLLPRSARITQGSILFKDRSECSEMVDILSLSRDDRKFRRIRGRDMSIVFQEPMTSLSPLHTIGDQISEVVRLHQRLGYREAYGLSVEMLRLVRFPDAERALSRYPFELSGGLRQRVMIAMALICRPWLLIADEPTTALDVTIQAQILSLLHDLQSELQMAMLLITHDLGIVANLAQDVVVLYHGQVMEAGSVGDIFRTPQHPYLKALLQAVPRLSMGVGERLVPLREIKLPAQHHFYNSVQQSVPFRLLEVEGLLKCYRSGRRWSLREKKEVFAIKDVGFTVESGECLGLVGESGCGKTTLAHILMRAVVPDQGRIFFQDQGRWIDVLRLKGQELVDFRRLIQVIFQDPFSSLNPRMTIYDILTEPLVIHGIGEKEYQEELVKDLMSMVGLSVRDLKRYPHGFSGGQRQRIGIARALALKPKMIICDEPVSALDVSIQAQILNLLKDLQVSLGLTYLFISHNLAVVKYIADRIMVMCRGYIVEVAECEELFSCPMHPYTQMLLDAIPEPDPQRPLDFTRLDRNASEPTAWPEPFTLSPTRHSHLVDKGNGHFVRVGL